MPENAGEQFLHQKNPTLHISDSVQHEMDRKILAKEKISQKPADKILDWLKVLEQTHMNHGNDSRVQDRIKNYYHNLIITPHKERLAKAAANVEEKAARTLGIDAQYGEEQLDQRGDIAVKDLEKSLDQWLDYLSSKDQTYPMWFRYYVFTNIIQLSDFDRDQEKFPKRTKDTVRLFPEIDRGALAHVLDIIKASRDDDALKNIVRAQKMAETPEHDILTKQKAILFTNKSFADQYADAIKLNGYITPEMRAETRGKWIKYEKGSNPTPLWQSLQNKGTSWCTKGYETAKTQLQAGDFYVYYTYEKIGKATIPRIAIRMQGDEIFEVRGVSDKDQNLEGNMTEIAKEKLTTLPNPEKFEKKVADMKQLTQIENKIKNFQELSKEELIFIYEIDSKIDGFGYDRDPRIQEILDKRNAKIDAPIVLDCQPSEIAWSKDEINNNTKAYIGPLFEGIFKNYKNLENIFTSFPEGKIRREPQEAGGKSNVNLEKELRENKINVGTYAEQMMKKSEFTTLKSRETFDLVYLKVSDLGFTKNPTTEELYERAIELGLDLCPPEIGPELRLKYKDQPLSEYKYIAMKPITDSVGHPSIFKLEHDGDGLWLHSNWTNPDNRWDLDDEMVFCLRK